MLSTPAPFPHPGAFAFLRNTVEPVRIIQRNADGTCLVQHVGAAFRFTGASTERTVPVADLAATETEAIGLARRGRGRGATL